MGWRVPNRGPDQRGIPVCSCGPDSPIDAGTRTWPAVRIYAMRGTNRRGTSSRTGRRARGIDPDSPVSGRQRPDISPTRITHGPSGRVATAGFFTVARPWKAQLHRGNTRRNRTGLRNIVQRIRERYRPDFAARRFQWSISACAVAGFQASGPAINGCRMPSTADDVFADTHSALRARLADLRCGLVRLRLMLRILRGAQRG